MFPSDPGTPVCVVLGLLSIWSVFLTEKSSYRKGIAQLSTQSECPLSMPFRNVLVFLLLERLELFELFLNSIVNIFLELYLRIELKFSLLASSCYGICYYYGILQC